MNMIIDRLTKMFNPGYEDNDYVKKLFFDRVNQIKIDDISKSEKEYRTFIEDCQIYINHDRPLQINKMIEFEVMEKFEEMQNTLIEIEAQDNHYLKGIIDYRNIIFSNYE